ncbi:MAG: DUF3240 family protein [Gammaproteobacteria bacterium]|nr:DUF3240 family protein [Gammaproteobacteria bacterium]
MTDLSRNFHQVLVVLTVPGELEEAIVDWLLEHGPGGFTTCPVRGHGADAARLTLAEQVSGRQRRLQFQVQIDGEACSSFLSGLRASLPGADIHYWVLPVLGGGSL